MLIRSARPGDAPALSEIYRPYVENTAVSFEYDPPTPEEFARRIAGTLEKYPYLVLEEEGRPRGYAYAGPLKSRAAYDWSAEASIYVEESAHGRGYGRALYEALEEALREMGVRTVYACIAWADREDALLTHASPRFHERMGYARCGTFRRCAFKFGRWWDMIWMEKQIAPCAGDPGPVRWRER